MAQKEVENMKIKSYNMDSSHSNVNLTDWNQIQEIWYAPSVITIDDKNWISSKLQIGRIEDVGDNKDTYLL